MEKAQISLFSRILMEGNGGQTIFNDSTICHTCNCQEEVEEIKKEVIALEETIKVLTAQLTSQKPNSTFSSENHSKKPLNDVLKVKLQDSTSTDAESD